MTRHHIKSFETVFLLVVLFLTVFVGTALLQAPKIKYGMRVYNATLAGTPVSVIVADDPIEIKLGLSVFTRLKRNEAILFVMPKLGYWQVSTKKVSFPTDIFWLDENFKVVDIYQYAPERSSLLFNPSAPAKYILQTNADFAQLYQIQVGDKLIFEQ